MFWQGAGSDSGQRAEQIGQRSRRLPPDQQSFMPEGESRAVAAGYHLDPGISFLRRHLLGRPAGVTTSYEPREACFHGAAHGR